MIIAANIYAFSAIRFLQTTLNNLLLLLVIIILLLLKNVPKRVHIIRSGNHKINCKMSEIHREENI